MFHSTPRYSHLLLALLLAVPLSQAVQAAETVNPALSERMEMLDVFNLEYIADAQIAPDGEHIVYMRHFSDVMTDQQHSYLVAKVAAILSWFERYRTAADAGNDAADAQAASGASS